MTRSDVGKRSLVPDDIYHISLISDAQMSPDGRQVAYIRTTLDKDKDDYRSSVYVVDVTGGQPRRFTAADAKDTFVRWSPAGDRLAFLSNRSGKNQIWTISASGGEAARLTDLPEAVSYLAWSPDGATIAFVSKLEPSQLEQRDGEPEGDSAGEAKSDVVHITRMRYRSDGTPGFLDNKRTHLWCVSVGGGAPWQVTTGDFDDARPCWSPTGQELVFSSNRTAEREYNTVSEIWAAHLRGGEARPIAAGDSAHFSLPAWSPDGSAIALAGNEDPVGGGSTNANVWIAAAAGDERRNLTRAFDRSVGESFAGDTSANSNPGLVWSPDGQWVYFQVSDSGSVHVYRVAAAGGDVDLVIGGARRVQDFSLSADGSRLAYVAGEALNPCDVYTCNADGSDERRLTAANREFLESVALSRPEEFRVRTYGEDGAEIQCWVMKPVGFQPGQKYPLVLEIHGGPHSMYGNGYFNEFQLLAARGYVVLFTNPHGSQGYGEQFTKYTRAAWGEKDLPDLMAALDHVIAQGYVDANRLGVTGGSYGGFMTNWVIGHTDRFKAAVTQRCLSNLYSFYGTSDIGFHFGEYEIGAIPWEDGETYVRLSPITYVRDMKTPLLIIHSEQDYRCPIEQGEQLFVALKKLGQEVEMVRFPNESHGLSRGGKPKHRVERLQHLIGWFDRHL